MESEFCMWPTDRVCHVTDTGGVVRFSVVLWIHVVVAEEQEDTEY